MNVKKTRRVFLMLGLVMMLSVVLAACVNTENVSEIIDSEFSEDPETSEIIDDTSEIETPDGYTPAPKNVTAVNISPDTVAVSGTCEVGATITVTGGVEEVTAVSRDGYFIAEVQLPYEKNQLDVTAKVEDYETSLPFTLIASYNATADTRLDGNSVSVGADSRLYFDKMLDDVSGENIYTESELSSIRRYVSNTITTYYEAAGAYDAELIYVLIPNVTTIYSDIIPEGSYEQPYTTIYDQVYDSLVNHTRATVVDMREVFQGIIADEEASKLAEEKGGIYRITDSSLTDYGAYLTYEAIMNKVAERFPDAAPRGIDEFDWTPVTTMGGNLVQYRELDKSVITEDIIISKPNFDMKLGGIGSIRKYVDVEDGDYSYFTTVSSSDEYTGIAERLVIDTAATRTGIEVTDEATGESATVLPALPNALIYRDYSAISFTDILAERFNKSLIIATGEYSINLNYAKQNAAEGKKVVDYIIVIVSEDSMDSAFNLAISQG